jgi:superfamily II DNA or RNA helicase
MIVDENKLKRQNEAANRWRYSKDYGSSRYGFGTLWLPTGFGKTFLALNCIAKPMLEKKPATTITILVHRKKLRKQWKDRVSQFVGDQYNISIHTVQYCIENKMKFKTDLLVVDEVHKFYGDEFFSFVDGTNIKYKYLLCLSATVKDTNNRHKKLLEFCPIIDHIDEQEALRNGWISQYIEYNLGIDLDDDEVLQYNAICKKVYDNLAKFGDHGFNGAMKVLSGCDRYTGLQYAMMWAKKMGWNQSDPNCQWNPNRIIGYGKKVMKGINERKKFLYECHSKLKATLDVIRKFKDDYKIMSFSESTHFADRVNDILNKSQKKDICVVYHTNLESRTLKDNTGKIITYGKTAKKAGEPKMFGKTTLKRLFIERFVNNEVNVLSTAKALDEGFDCDDIQIGILSSRTSNYNQQKQRGGRVKRVIPKSPKDKMLLVNIYVKHTKDYDWLTKAQKENTNTIHWVSSIDDIEFDYNDDSAFDDL